VFCIRRQRLHGLPSSCPTRVRSALISCERGWFSFLLSVRRDCDEASNDTNADAFTGRLLRDDWRLESSTGGRAVVRTTAFDGPSTVRKPVSEANQADLAVLKELCETGQVRLVIDSQFSLSDVFSAVRYVEDGHARGKVVVTV